MGMLQEYLAKRRERKEMQSSIENQNRAVERIEAKRKSANERELEGYYERERKKRIDKALAAFRKRDQDEFWHGKNIMKQKDLFKEEAYNSILKTRNIFS